MGLSPWPLLIRSTLLLTSRTPLRRGFFVSKGVDTSTSLSSVVGIVDVSDLPDFVLASYDADATNKPVLQSVSVGTRALSKGHPLHRSATVENRVWRRLEALTSQTFLLAGERQKPSGRGERSHRREGARHV